MFLEVAIALVRVGRGRGGGLNDIQRRELVSWCISSGVLRIASDRRELEQAETYWVC